MSKSLMLLLAGIGIGILIAPDKGTETRRKLLERLEGYKDDAEDFIDDSSDKVKSKIQSAKSSAKGYIDDKL